jgi:hypothetical protein
MKSRSQKTAATCVSLLMSTTVVSQEKSISWCHCGTASRLQSNALTKAKARHIPAQFPRVPENTAETEVMMGGQGCPCRSWNPVWNKNGGSFFKITQNFMSATERTKASVEPSAVVQPYPVAGKMSTQMIKWALLLALLASFWAELSPAQICLSDQDSFPW